MFHLEAITDIFSFSDSLAAKSCFNLLDTDGRSVLKRDRDDLVHHNTTANKYQANESFPSESFENRRFFKNGALFTNRDKTIGEKNWSKNRILQPAKSTPSLLHITDEAKTNASINFSSTSEGRKKFDNTDLLHPSFHGK